MKPLLSPFSKLLFLSIFLTSFASCDKCKDVTCENDGVCSKGECQCKNHYSGDDCAIQETPTHVRIKKVTFTGLQQLLSEDWDAPTEPSDPNDLAPDVYMTLERDGVEGYWFTSDELYENTRDSRLTFTRDLPITYEDVLTNITFVIWNQRFNQGGEDFSDLLFYTRSRLYDDQNDFNTTIVLTGGKDYNGDEISGITVEVEVEYVFD